MTILFSFVVLKMLCPCLLVKVVFDEKAVTWWGGGDEDELDHIRERKKIHAQQSNNFPHRVIYIFEAG